jgi:hypothetical protein
MTPTPALPGAVASAMMGSFLVIIAGTPYLFSAAKNLFNQLLSEHLIDLPLLSNRQQVVHYPVQNQACREEEEHDRKHDGHVQHYLGLNRIWRGWV